MNFGDKDDWDLKRKEIEDQIDNGLTYSHWTRYHPVKREWQKYVNLLKKRDRDLRKRDAKIREIREDLQEKGIVNDKIVTKELEMFEYKEMKKVQDRAKARLGAKAAGYYRPVDTDRTLKIEKISMNFSDGYDDGPGGFQIEDFSGIETMFSKQSLEQRKIRVDRARDRLRQKRLQRMEEKKQKAIEEARLLL